MMGYKVKSTAGVLFTVLLLLFEIVLAKDVYYMDTTLDCGYIGVQDINRDQNVLVHAKTSDTSAATQNGCTLNFQTRDSDSTVKVEFTKFRVDDCSVKLYLSGSGNSEMRPFSCGESPQTYFSIGRTVTITLHKGNNGAQNYDFTLRLSAIRDDRYPLPSDSNPVAVGLVIGIVGAIFGFIFIVTCVGICCFRKYRAGRPIKMPFGYNNSKAPLETSSRSTAASVGYTNESMRGSPASKKKLLAPSDSSDDRSDHLRSNMNRNQSRANVPPPAPPPPPNVGVANNNRSENKPDLRNGDTNNGARGNMLNALQSHNKFRNSFKENERDAEERAKRISSSSFEKFGEAPRPPSSDENLSRPSLQPVPKSPKGKKSKHAGISRNPRSASFSSDELNQIEKGRLAASRENVQDRSFSSDENKPQSAAPKGKANTTHSLKPDRKGPKGRKKQTQSVSSAIDPEPEFKPQTNTGRPPDGRGSGPRNQKDRFLDANRDEPFEKMGSGRYSKRSNGRKSPRPGKSSGRGFGHRRGRSMDQLDSRPTTPTSMFGSVEDLAYPSPLQRASSKTSLYSSRSSLYDRRRRRKGSNSGSVVSYIRDDMSVGRHSRGYDDEYSSDEEDFDGYERPISRRDRNRLYRSENDLGRKVKEIATQTLRETATQTGLEESVVSENKRLVKKKRRSKSVSSSGTQTTKKEKKKTKSTERLDRVGKDSKEKSEKAKRSKSVPDFSTTEDEEKPKPSPRPKPKPRKSLSADTHLDEAVTAGSKEEPTGPYYPQSEGFVPQPYPPQSYPMIPPPSYGQQPGVPYNGYPGQGQPMHGVPQGYPDQGMAQSYPGQGMPHGGPQGYPGQGMPQGQGFTQGQSAPIGPQGYPMQGLPPQQQGYPVPPQNLPPQPQNPAVARKLRKSNWEMLCEMTDGEYKRDDVTETGSIASSVFTNNPVSMQGYNVGYQNPPPPAPGYNTQPQFYIPQQPSSNQVARPVQPVQHVPSQPSSSGSSSDNGYTSAKQTQDYENAEIYKKQNPGGSQSNLKKSSDKLITRTESPVPVAKNIQQTRNYSNESVV